MYILFPHSLVPKLLIHIFLFEFSVVYLTILPSSFRFLFYLLLSGSDDLRRHLPKFLRSVLIPVRIDAVDDFIFSGCNAVSAVYFPVPFFPDPNRNG